jgi:hypothetical protein
MGEAIMPTTKIGEGEWHRYFDTVGSALQGRKATVQVIGPDIGAQFAAEDLGIIGITYDQKDQLLEIALDGLDHLIRHPREIYIDETPDGAAMIEVVDADEHKHIIQIRPKSSMPQS